ncbi:MAG: NADP-dependent oxidoreductase [Gemmatimonadales bacterium]
MERRLFSAWSISTEACRSRAPVEARLAGPGPELFHSDERVAQAEVTVKAARIHAIGGPEVIVIDEIAAPTPGPHEVVIRVAAAGVGPWDALIREGKSVVSASFPLIPGSDLCGTVDRVGNDVSSFKPGDRVYGSTNSQFIGAYAERAVASAGMIAPAPRSLSNLEAASAPTVAVTAWQMLFEHAKATPGQTVLIHGGAGNVGAYAVQLASRAGLHVISTASLRDTNYVRKLGAAQVIDYQSSDFATVVSAVDIVLDTVGGETRARSVKVLKPGGILVSIVGPFAERDIPGIRTAFFLAAVTTERLNALTPLFDRGELEPDVGTVLPLEQARIAHEMLAGAPHARGKIVLRVD